MDGEKYVVVIFGDKRKHSDVIGIYDYEEATRVADRLTRRDGFDTYAFPIQTEEDYTKWLRGEV